MRIIAIVLFGCVLFAGAALFAQDAENAAPEPDKTVEDNTENTADTGRNTAGIIIQIVLMILFVAVMYWVFIYPEGPKNQGKSDETASSDSEDKQDEAEDKPAEEENKADDKPEGESSEEATPADEKPTEDDSKEEESKE